jgi:hypothetical protein
LELYLHYFRVPDTNFLPLVYQIWFTKLLPSSSQEALNDIHLQADVQAVKEALSSAVDVLNAVEGSVHLLLPKV